MPDLGGFPTGVLRLGPDLGGAPERWAYAQQLGTAGMPKANAMDPSRRGPRWFVQTNLAGVNASRRFRAENGVGIGLGGAANASVICRTTDGENYPAVEVGVSLDWSCAASNRKGTWVMLAGLRVATATYAISYDDGASWAIRSMPVAATWNVCEYENGIFLAIEGGITASSVAYISFNGEDWIPAPMNAARNWSGAAYSYDLDYWIAMDANTGTRGVAKSYNNARTWAASIGYPLGISPPIERIVWAKPASSNAGVFLFPAGAARPLLAFSIDPAVTAFDDTSPLFSTGGTWSNVVFGQGVFVTITAVSGYNIGISENGRDGWNDSLNNRPANVGGGAPNLGYLGGGRWGCVYNGTAFAALGVG